jgi:hypothetical protein
MSSQVRGIHVPVSRECLEERCTVLPANRASVQKHKGQTGGRTFRMVDRNRARTELLLAHGIQAAEFRRCADEWVLPLPKALWLSQKPHRERAQKSEEADSNIPEQQVID